MPQERTVKLCEAPQAALLSLVLPALTAGGVETLGAAATAGAIKQQEIEQGRIVQQQVQQQPQQSMDQTQQQRAEQMDQATR
jgi:uncharacterized protein involved in propanediol utilization